MIVILGVGLAVMLFALIFWLLLTRRIREKYAILWLVISLGVVVVGVFPGLLTRLTALLGVQLPSNLLFASAILLLIGVSLHLSYELSHAEEEIRRTAEEAAIAGARIDDLERRLRRLEESAPDHAPDPESERP